MGLGRWLGFHDPSHSDPPEVRNLRIYTMSIVVSFGAAAMGYDTAVIGGTLALEAFKRDFGLDVASQFERDTLSGNIVSTFQAGTFFGALLAFPFAEKFGRKKAMIASAIIFLAGAVIMTCAAGRLSMIYAGRCIAGLGIGSASLVIPVYISEIAPSSIRGLLVGIFEIMSQGGGMLGFWINYACDQTIDPQGPKQWLIPIGLQIIPGVLLALGAIMCVESPRWLGKVGRWAEAEATLSYARKLPGDSDFVRNEIAGIRDEVERESEVVGGDTSRFAKFKELAWKGNRGRLLIGLALMCCQNMTGVNILTYYSPRILETLGFTGTSTKLFATGFYGLAKTVGMIVFSLWVAERVGRKKGLYLGAFIGSIPMWYIGGYVFVADPAARAARGEFARDGWGYLALVCVYLYGFIYCATWQGITWAYCSEIFPIRIRMLCVALTTADQWFWSFLVSRTTPYMITSWGYGAYFFFSSLMVIMGFWSFFFVPETKGLTLEQMHELFGDAYALQHGDVENIVTSSEEGKGEIEQQEIKRKTTGSSEKDDN